MVRHLLASRNTRFVINSAWPEPDSKYSQAVPRTQSVPLRRCTNYNRNTVDIYSHSLGSAVLWRTHDVRTNLVTCARCASFFFSLVHLTHFIFASHVLGHVSRTAVHPGTTWTLWSGLCCGQLMYTRGQWKAFRRFLATVWQPTYSCHSECSVVRVVATH